MKSYCKVTRNPYGPARFTGNHLRWICETPDGDTYCDTREGAREVARDYNSRMAYGVTLAGNPARPWFPTQ
jgi:hypothetical protein